MLIKAGCISEKELKAALETEKKNSQSWHEILISKGQLKKAFLERSSNVVIKQTLLEVFSGEKAAINSRTGIRASEHAVVPHTDRGGDTGIPFASSMNGP